MPIQDRTNEFRTCIDSARSRNGPGMARGAEQKQQLLQQHRAGNGGSKSQFTQLATGIGKEISATSLKLGKLGQLARRKTLFDDRPVEISELTYIIKQDIASLNRQIAALQAHVKQRAGAKGEAKLVEEHESNVVMLLQSKLANISMAFKDVLEIRTQNMKESKDRTEQFMHSTATAATQPPPSNSLLFAGGRQRQQEPNGNGLAPTPNFPSRSRTPQNGDILAMDLTSAEEGSASDGGGAFMQMQLVEQQNDYIQQRSTAIESIESTIAELGQIFTQLAHMVAEQRETVQRIDADTQDIADNISGAQRELLKYYASISSNRWLILKIFGVLIVFFLVFILVS